MAAKKKPVRPGEIANADSITVTQLYKAYTTDYDGRDVGSIGYFSTEMMARSACGEGGHSSVKPVDVLQVVRDDQTKDQYDYYLLDDPAPVKADVNFELFVKQLREKAMAKLSDAEKEALGLVKKQ